MKHRWTRVGAAFAAAAVTATACGTAGVAGAASKAQGGSPFRILLLVPQSTTYLKTNAQTESLMAKAAATVVNKSGGAGHGHKVVLTIVNTGGSPTTAVTKLEAALSSTKKPNVVINGNASPEASAELPIVKQAHILMFNQAPTATSGKPSTNPTSFDLSPSTTNYVEGFVAYSKANHFKKIGIFHGNDSYGTAIGASMTKGAKAAGLTVVDNVQFKSTGLTYTPTLESLQGKKPDVVWVDGYGAPPSYTLQDIQKLGWNVPLIADDSYSVSPTIVATPPTGALGTSAEKNLKFETFAAGVYQPPSKTPKNVKTMLAAMRRQGSPKASLLFGYEYDAVIMAAYAARAANTTTTATKLSNEVVKQQNSKKKPPTGLFPTYGYTKKSHFATVPASSFSFVAPTKLVTGLFGTPTAG